MLVGYLLRHLKSSSQANEEKPAKLPCIHQRRQGDQRGRDEGKNVDMLVTVPDEPAAGVALTGMSKQQQSCQECKVEKRTARKYRWKLIGGLIFPFALQALDVTIIASALPFIAQDFGQLSQLNWIVSAFNLTSAAFIPFWGQTCDIFGRYAALQASVILMLVGSALCTAAPTSAYPVLLLGRALQGLGAAGVNVGVRVVLADRASLAENAKNWTIFSTTAGISYGLGPVIGGYLTDAHWRWCFGINLPVGVLAVVGIWLLLRRELLGPQPLPELDEASGNGTAYTRRTRFAARLATVDVGGQVLFMLGFGLLVLAFTWAGGEHPWNSAAVLVPLCSGALVTVAFVLWERAMSPGGWLVQRSDRLRRQRPMIPWNIMADLNIGLSFYIAFATGFAMFAVLYYCDIYFAIVRGFGPDKAGVQLLFYTPGLAVGVYLSMFLCNRWPRQTFWPILLGSIIEAVGLGLMAWAIDGGKNATIFGMMALTGAGTALRFLPGPLHCIGFFPGNISSIIALLSVAHPFGGSLGLTIMSTVFNNLAGESKELLPLLRTQGAPADVLAPHVFVAKRAVVWAFVAIMPFMILCIFTSLGLGSVNITDNKQMDPTNIVAEPYPLYLLRRRRSKTSADDSEKTAVAETATS